MGVALAACAPAGPSPFGGTWTAISAPGVTVESNLEAPRFQFVGDPKTLRGSTNCSDFSVPIAIAGRTISIGEFSISESGPCTARDREIEAAVVAALRDAVEIRGGLPGDRLHLSGSGGELILAQPTPDFPADDE
jgi:heat shock protein HslJ